MSFLGKVVLITGASSGIGAATAHRLAKQGATLALSGRNVENLKAVAKDVGADKSFVVPGDVTKEADTENILKNTIEKYGKLDVLINNAGILETGSIENTSLEQFDRLINTNVRSIYHLTMLAVPHLIKTQGAIVNVSSVNGIRSFPGVLAYNISKTAVDQLTRCVALELAAKNVRCNSVNPGVTITNLHKRGGMTEDAYAKFLEHSKTTHAMGRPGQAIEIADAIVFLAGDASSFITGVNLPVDGGRHAMCPR
ncbi:3-oxoacyl-[acyl-carrier-protein] reductase FabG-like [Sitodiplosis mosellana]|uniref:3-oxoacyl-[acyl-carrier-protein] reductase FabG-like n=1 Tax=Sitodiplosis mosellana TaxID=263140 RepID=UPI0024446F93|nr:3-oxoacyl-[acyl-carrier-protein] reductase FabG-like [Sitodiplosis mosellana]